MLVLKKLDDEYRDDFLRVLRFLGLDEHMHVLVEPHEHSKLRHDHDFAFLDTFHGAEAARCLMAAALAAALMLGLLPVCSGD